jgi:hypothetical protein
MNHTSRGRRPEPLPPSRELVAGAILLALAALCLTPLATQGAVVFVQTGTFAWPTNPVAALVDILHGHYGRGLSRDDARHLPGTRWLTTLSLLAGCAGAAGLGALARFALGAGTGFGVFGTSSGLGTPRDARGALGESALRRRAAVIRPDLIRPRPRGRRSQEQTR